MWLLIAIILAFTSSIMVASLSRLEKKVAFILAVGLIFFTQIVLIAQFLSIFYLINKVNFVIGHLVIFLIIFIIWKKKQSSFKINKFCVFKDLNAVLRQDIVLRIFCYLVLTGLVASFLMGLLLPPSNYDSMTYHLPRVMHWIENQTLRPYFTHIWRQVRYPFTGTLGLLWLMLLSGSDKLLSLLQWNFLIGIMVAIYGISRLINLKARQALFSALIFATLPIVVVQSSTTQNDLVLSFFVITAFYFLISGNLAFSALALGLALGTKLTAVFVLPGLVISALVIIKDKKQVVRYALIALAAFIIVGFYHYFYNLDFLLNFSSHQSGLNLAQDGIIKNSLLSIKNYFIGFFDSAGYIHEDTSYFGPLGFLLYLPLLVFYLIPVNFKKYKISGLFALSSVLFIASCALIIDYNPWAGRFFIIIVGLLSVPAGRLYQDKKAWLSNSIMVIAAIVLILSLTGNESKNLGSPLAERPVIYRLSRMEQQFINAPEKLALYKQVDEVVPIDGAIGIIIGADDWEYPLYGRELKREVIHIEDESNIPMVDYLLIKKDRWQFLKVNW